MERTREFTTQEDSAPEWEVEARSRLAESARKFSQPLTELIDREANEGDTRMLVADFLSDGLNYDKYESLTTEHRTKGDSVDYGIVIDGKLFALVEVKPCGQDLDARHMRQVKSHAANENLDWIILTNGRLWRVYHLTGEDRSGTELIIDVDLLAETEAEATLDFLFHVCREAVEHGRLDNLRNWRASLASEPLADVLQAGPVINAVRTEVRRRTGHLGHIGDAEDIARALREDVIARRVVD